PTPMRKSYRSTCPCRRERSVSEQQTDPVTASGASLTMAMEGAVAVLSLGHAPYNLMDEALNTELVNGLEWSQRQGARAVILRSSLRHFSAGADLDQMVADAATRDVLNWGFAGPCAPPTGSPPPPSPACTASASAAGSSSPWPATSSSPPNRRNSARWR